MFKLYVTGKILKRKKNMFIMAGFAQNMKKS